MKRKIIVFFYNLFKSKHERLVNREIRKSKILEEKYYFTDDFNERVKLKILQEKFNALKKKIQSNHDLRFTKEQLYEFCILKKEFNQIKESQKTNQKN